MVYPHKMHWSQCKATLNEWAFRRRHGKLEAFCVDSDGEYVSGWISFGTQDVLDFCRLFDGGEAKAVEGDA